MKALIYADDILILGKVKRKLKRNYDGRTD
jgi:hypothetical protein